MRVNYHTHTCRCRHAGGTEADFVRAAVEAGVGILGFSDHGPFPDVDFGYRMPFSELGEYLEAVGRAAEELAGGMRVLKGLEIEYLPRYSGYYRRLLGEYGLDYLLLGQHLYEDGGVLRNITGAGSTGEYTAYARSVAEALGTGLFRAVAHPDIFAMNPLPWDENCEAACGIIISAALETGTALEYNANGFRRGIHDYPEGPRYMYPVRRFWEKVPPGVRVLVGSDCHDPSQLWDSAMDLAYEQLRELGITPAEEI